MRFRQSKRDVNLMSPKGRSRRWHKTGRFARKREPHWTTVGLIVFYLLVAKTIKRHPTTFAKTARGLKRHAERHFALAQKQSFFVETI